MGGEEELVWTSLLQRYIESDFEELRGRYAR